MEPKRVRKQQEYDTTSEDPVSPLIPCTGRRKLFLNEKQSSSLRDVRQRSRIAGADLCATGMVGILSFATLKM